MPNNIVEEEREKVKISLIQSSRIGEPSFVTLLFIYPTNKHQVAFPLLGILNKIRESHQRKHVLVSHSMHHGTTRRSPFLGALLLLHPLPMLTRLENQF